MASKTEVNYVLERLKHIQPHQIVAQTKLDHRGMTFVVKYLYHHEGQAFTHELSDIMGISTARVSTLINKLESRGFVTRQIAEDDRRKTLITLTEVGRTRHQMIESKIYESFGHLIDSIGLANFEVFLQVLEQMKVYLQDHPFSVEEEEGNIPC